MEHRLEWISLKVAFPAKSEPGLGWPFRDDTRNRAAAFGNDKILAGLLYLIEQLQALCFELRGCNCYHVTSLDDQSQKARRISDSLFRGFEAFNGQEI